MKWFHELKTLLKDKPRLWHIIFESDDKPSRMFDIVVMVAIVVSLVVAFVESMPSVAGRFADVLTVLEYVLTVFFTIEYALRVYCSPVKREYTLSFFGIVDLIATLPVYLQFILPGAKYMFILRAFRLIRVFRVFKLFAFINEGYLLLSSLKQSMTKILVYFLFVLILVTAIGTLMFMFEGQIPDTQFTDIPTSIYWAIVTLTTVGYGDITPVTGIGRFLSAVVMILGYTIIAVPTGIVSATMIDETKKKGTHGRCPRCNQKTDLHANYCKHCGERLIVLLLSLTMFCSCVKEMDYDNSNRGNFESLWQQMDERYCFFDYKDAELGVDWNEVHERYSAMITEKMTRTQLFEVLANMLAELKDGHVNLGAPFDLGRNWSFYEEYPLNYNDSIVGLYLGKNYHIASGLKYCILPDNICYVRCESFQSSIGSGNVSHMLNDAAMCNGIIIDVRGNGGGALTNAHTLASHFTNEKLLIGYVSHKTGKGHSDFSTPRAEWLEPEMQGLRWQKPCVVLTNRQCYSATNDFVKCMKLCPKVTVLGDRTGGGSGMPFTSELPNGWSLRYSSVVYLDKDMHHTEFGIEPDIPLQMSGADTERNKDTYIEAARKLINGYNLN